MKFGERLVGLAVHELVEIQEIMVRSLAEGMGEVKGISGAGILGNGCRCPGEMSGLSVQRKCQ